MAAALQLKSRNDICPVIYEVRSAPTTLGGAIMVPCNGLQLLDQLGVYDEICHRAPKLINSTVYSSRGTKLGEFTLGSWSAKKTGYTSMRIKRTDLQAVLLDKVRQLGIHIHFDKRIVAIEEQENGVKVSFSDGTEDSAQLLLGCDGIHSSVRTLYVDQQLSPEYSGIATIYSFVAVSSLGSPATVPTSALTGMTGTFTQHGIFGVMPCTVSRDTLFWLFSYEVPIPSSGDSREGWEEHSQREQEGFKVALLGILASIQTTWGAFVRDVVENTDAVKFYPIFRLPLGNRWFKGNCLLLGDAAHAMQPHVGQGVSMGLEDVFLLSRLLQAASPEDPLSGMFEKFDRIRRPRIEKFYGYASQRVKDRKATSPWGQWMKEVLIWVVLRLIIWTSLHKMGIGERGLLYDINEVPI